jgi:hypothetical protein
MMRNHYHLVLETPHAALVSGRAWLEVWKVNSLICGVATSEKGADALLALRANLFGMTPALAGAGDVATAQEITQRQIYHNGEPN